LTLLWLLVLSLAFLLTAGCTTSATAAVKVDRRNPESVLHAYFDAWQRSDWSTQASLMDEKYSKMVPEPLD
jgi:hypothetical protein